MTTRNFTFGPGVLPIVSPARTTLCCSLAAALSTSAAATASPSLSASPQRIVVVGDSLAVSPSRALNFTAELQARRQGIERSLREEAVALSDYRGELMAHSPFLRDAPPREATHAP